MIVYLVSALQIAKKVACKLEENQPILVSNSNTAKTGPILKKHLKSPLGVNVWSNAVLRGT